MKNIEKWDFIYENWILYTYEKSDFTNVFFLFQSYVNVYHGVFNKQELASHHRSQIHSCPVPRLDLVMWACRCILSVIILFSCPYSIQQEFVDCNNYYM